VKQVALFVTSFLGFRSATSATKMSQPIFEVDRDLGGGLSVSPDGRWILYSQEGVPSGDIMLVNHFH